MSHSSEPSAPDARDPRRPRRRLWIAGGALVAAAVVVTAAVAVGNTRAAGSSPRSHTNGYGQFVGEAAAAWSAHPVVTDAHGTEVHVVAGSPTCIDDWRGGTTGAYAFDVLNDEGDDMEIFLQDTATKKIFLDVENFGINATRQVSGVIPPGRFQWVCITAYTIKRSKPFRVTGEQPSHPVVGVVPVSPLAMRIPINTYTAWVLSRLPGLTARVERLAADLRAGEVAAAKRDWLTAHVTYETLGAAYQAFGPIDADVNADPSFDRPAVSDPNLTGFRKVEALLWSGAPTMRIVPYGDRLVADIRKLPAQLALPNAITPLDMGNRAHEILENTLGTDLNDRGDAGSGTELATVDANLTGTMEALTPLRPILVKQDPWLGQTQSVLRRLQHLVESYRGAQGWKPLSALTVRQRAEVDAGVQQAVELLSRVPPIVEPRDNPDEEGGVGLISGGAEGGSSK